MTDSDDRASASFEARLAGCVVGRLRSEQPRFLRRAPAAEPDRHPSPRQQIRHGHLLGDVERIDAGSGR